MVIVTYDEFGGQWDHVSRPDKAQRQVRATNRAPRTDPRTDRRKGLEGRLRRRQHAVRRDVDSRRDRAPVRSGAAEFEGHGCRGPVDVFQRRLKKDESLARSATQSRVAERKESHHAEAFISRRPRDRAERVALGASPAAHNAAHFYLPDGTCHEVGSNKDAPIVGAGNPNQSPGSNDQPGQLDLIPGNGDRYGPLGSREQSTAPSG